MKRVFTLFFLSACAATGGSEFPDVAAGDACAAKRYDFLRDQPRSVLTGVNFTYPVRIVGPGDAVTMDYNPSRMTILLDDLGIIREITCG